MLDSGLDPDKASHFVSNIYLKYGSFIRKAIRCHLKDEYRVDDVFQSFFMDLIVRPAPNDVEHIENYLYRAVLNCVAENVRQKACYQTHLDVYAEKALMVETEKEPEIALIDTEETAKIFTLIRKQLTKKEFLAINLCYGNNFDICEIASAMGVKAKSVRQYLFRGLEKLRSPLISGEILAASR